MRESGALSASTFRPPVAAPGPPVLSPPIDTDSGIIGKPDTEKRKGGVAMVRPNGPLGTGAAVRNEAAARIGRGPAAAGCVVAASGLSQSSLATWRGPAAATPRSPRGRRRRHGRGRENRDGLGGHCTRSARRVHGQCPVPGSASGAAGVPTPSFRSGRTDAKQHKVCANSAIGGGRRAWRPHGPLPCRAALRVKGATRKDEVRGGYF